MLNAIVKKNFNILSGIKEDSLTSSVFDYLFMLPDNLIWHIIKESCYDNDNLPKYVGELLEFDFWPKWSTKDLDEVNNTNHVEPDVFIDFEQYHIIIEAKRFDNKTQNENQWKNQIKAYQNEFKDEEGNNKKDLIYFAVGGVWTENTATNIVDEQSVYKIRWQRILDTLNITKKSLSINDNLLPQNSSYIRIIGTIIEALALHGYNNFKWLKTLEKQNIQPKTIKTLEQWKIKMN